ncbi:fatty acid CoA ligase family protein [Aeoliella sp. ICT_H6.2]|uniref:Fatty acid CoA ligase family protein n=1 Tax=Aeoliella straminimaris TaxID=2954799 RepID=A0A9X2FAZ2_9BACT|nr:fatty acid CoA ligase family protein [Aeoliella straminimaris]MCO6044857.1 fatty acid CoA ligase family protein [Aeoliella straminimaris]
MEKPRVNVADALHQAATAAPERKALVEAWGAGRSITAAELDEQASILARGLIELGVQPGTRIALLVKPSIEFVTLVFALLRSGATMVLVDSGLGRKNIVRCLASTEPEGFVAIPLGHALRLVKRREFPKAKLNVNVGPTWLPLGKPLTKLYELGQRSNVDLPHTSADDPAAIVFTSGSTGPPKGVVYRHETFTTQLAEIQRMYGLEAGGVDLACFPLFGLFNVAMGITTVLPEMDFSRPASADPKKLLAAANQCQVTQSFASPAVWDLLSRHCQQTGESIPTLKKVFSCGAPVGAEVIERTLTHVCPGAELHTPYGATESLPVSTIEAQEILNDTAEKTRTGAGVCVGRKVDSVEWRVIKITDEPIAKIEETEELSQGKVGELIVRGPQVSREYLTPNSPRRESRFPTSATHNELAKITDGDSVWHRIGDVGYLDEQNRFWYCGRKSQRVVTSEGTLFTECVEQVVNTYRYVGRSALIGIGPREAQRAAIVIERPPAPPGIKVRRASWKIVRSEIRKYLSEDPHLKHIEHILEHSLLPTDIRHNAKINREQLAKWAAKQLKKER